MAYASGNKDRPHLFSGLFALGFVVTVLFAGRLVAIHLERTTIHSTAPELFPLKNQGLAFQHSAVHAPNVLPLYGTSELIIPAVPEKGDNFFRTAPTGFQVSPVGGGGANLLVMLQKVGALGSDLGGKQLASDKSNGF
jgi:poly-D-alanine transfer protein DltD